MQCARILRDKCVLHGVYHKKWSCPRDLRRVHAYIHMYPDPRTCLPNIWIYDTIEHNVVCKHISNTTSTEVIMHTLNYAYEKLLDELLAHEPLVAVFQRVILAHVC